MTEKSWWSSRGGDIDVVTEALDYDVGRKDLHYYSMAKVRRFGLDSYSGGYGVGGGAVGVTANISKAAAPKSDRELLTDVGRHLQDCGQLVYETPDGAEPGSSYLLARTMGRYGNLWTFQTPEESPIRDVTWFKGEGARVRVLAYGSRQNLAREGDIPRKSDYRASWWPSDYGAHKGVVEYLADTASNEEHENANKIRESMNDVDSLVRYCFNDGVRRGQTYTYGLYEILLRVDFVDNSDSQFPWVVGSPIWFAKCSPGIYVIPLRSTNDAQCCEVYGCWNGGRWVNVFYGPENKRLRYILPGLAFLEGESDQRVGSWNSWCKKNSFGDRSGLMCCDY